MIERHSMHQVALFVFGVALGSAARPDISTGGWAQSASGGTATRQAFLKLIERPRVPLEPVTKPGSESAETVVEEISFAAEAGERVPALLMKRRTASSRRHVVIVLHGTGGSKDGMVPRLRDLPGRGFVAVAIDGRYHGQRARGAREGLSPYQDVAPPWAGSRSG